MISIKGGVRIFILKYKFVAFSLTPSLLSINAIIDTFFYLCNCDVCINLYHRITLVTFFHFSLLHICFSFLIYSMYLNAGGSGFKSLKNYRSGYFGSSIKLQPGFTAGIITSFYVSI